LIVHVAEHATHIGSADLSPRCCALIQKMSETAGDIWNQTTSAWYQRDGSAAGRLHARDDDLDSLHAALLAELATGQMALPVAMDMTLVGRYYERLATTPSTSPGSSSTWRDPKLHRPLLLD
jgi:phosphate uptake regulator